VNPQKLWNLLSVNNKKYHTCIRKRQKKRARNTLCLL